MRIGSRSPLVRSEPVAGSSHRLERRAAERTVDLLTQVADVDVDHVGAVLVAVIQARDPGGGNGSAPRRAGA